MNWRVAIISFILSFLISFTLLNAAKSDEWYNKQSGSWSVIGIKNFCSINTRWKDGSYFSITHDMTDGEYMLIYHNSDLRFPMKSDFYEAQLKFKGTDQLKNGLSITLLYEVVYETTIRFRGIDTTKIFPLLGKAKIITLELPVPYPLVDINMNGSYKSLDLLKECIQQHKVNKKSDKKPVDE